MAGRVFLGVDLGAESGRVVAGVFDGRRVRLEELHRFPNGPVELAGSWRWDVLRLWAEVKAGLAAAAGRFGPAVASVGVDTWGVDYVLLSKTGEPSARVTWHQVGTSLPEVVVFMPCGYYLEDAEEEAKALYRLYDFAETPAARAGDVYAVDATSYFSRPGPRIVDGLEILAWAIHPGAFPEPAADRITRIEG